MRTYGKKLFVLGDPMIDRWIYCESIRKSPETGVPILKESEVHQEIGGALNAIRHVRHQEQYIPIGTILVCGAQSEWIFVAEKLNGLQVDMVPLFENNRKITQKNRFFKNGVPLFRYDEDFTEEVSQETQEKIFDYFKACAVEIGCLLLSDYNKGYLAENLTLSLAHYCREKGIPTVMDTTAGSLTWISNIDVVKPNFTAWKEFTTLFGSESEAIKSLISRGNKEILITLGSGGLRLISEGTEKFASAEQIIVKDVTGAGDAIAAGVSLLLFDGKKLDECLESLNSIGALAVSQDRTSLS